MVAMSAASCVTVETAAAPAPATLPDVNSAVAAFVFVASADDVSSLDVAVSVVEMDVAVLAVAGKMKFVAMIAEIAAAAAEAAMLAAFGSGSVSGHWSSAPRVQPSQIEVLHGALRMSPPHCLPDNSPPQVWPEILLRAYVHRQADALSLAV